MAAGPVSRILSVLRRDGHSSGPRITARLKRPTRRLLRTEPARIPGEPRSLPIWSCSVWGLPCPLHYCNGGALLPHLFTLTPLPGRYVFCGTSRQPGLNPASRTLSGTLLCGVRTFLPRRPKAPRATVRSSCLPLHYMRCGRTGTARRKSAGFMRKLFVGVNNLMRVVLNGCYWRHR